MICPQCNQQPLTFSDFILKINQTKIKCKSCGAKLLGGKLLHTMFYLAIIFGLLLGTSIPVLGSIYGWEVFTASAVFLSVIFVVGIPAEIIAWKYGEYILDSAE